MKHAILGAAMAVALAVPAYAQDYTIMAPAAPGGGWDGTARSIQEVMQAEGIAPSVEVINVPGAGGTVGLAQFAADSAGDPTKLIVGGYVMVGAILTNGSPVSLKDVTPCPTRASISCSTWSVSSVMIMWKPKSIAALPSAFFIHVSHAS